MKKLLIAAAAMSVVAGAQAQSSVTISGNVDLGMSQVTNELTSGAQTMEFKNKGPVGNGAAGWTSSAIGIDVKEDLGGGMSAGYSAAMNLNSFGTAPDTASQLLGTGRHSYAYVAGNFGEARIGYQYTLDDQIQGGVGRATPTGNTGGRFQNFSLTGSAEPTTDVADLASGAVTRANGVEYKTPVVNGLQALVQVAQVRADVTASFDADSAKADTDLQSLAVKYSVGKLNLGVSYMDLTTDTATFSTAGNTKTENTHWNFAANYDFGVAKVFGNYVNRKGESTGSVNSGDVTKRKGFDLGVSAPVSPSTTVFATYGKGDIKAFDQSAATNSDAEVTAYQLAATYALSKRTSFTGYYSVTKADGESNLSGISLERTTIGAGLRHAF